jgi:hypothetical protein
VLGQLGDDSFALCVAGAQRAVLGLRRHERAFAAVNGATFAAWGLLGGESVAADVVMWPLCLAAAWGWGLLTHRRLVLDPKAGSSPATRGQPLPLNG